MSNHRTVICENGRCTGIVTVVPEDCAVELVRVLDRGEPSRLGHGTIWCPVCRTKWEVGPYTAMGEAA